jgi:hypothetical protein
MVEDLVNWLRISWTSNIALLVNGMNDLMNTAACSRATAVPVDDSSLGAAAPPLPPDSPP